MLIVGSVLGVLIVLLITYRDQVNSSANPDSPASVHQADVDTQPARERAPIDSRIRTERPAMHGSPTDLQAIPPETAGVGHAGARIGGMRAPEAEEVATDPQEATKPIKVGSPFRPSPSIEKRCRTRPVPTADSCSEVSRLIEEMSREDRDEAWATRTESQIRIVVAARQDGTQIRALECKTSLCAIETVSPAIEHLVILGQAEQESTGVIDDGDYVLAWEEDPARGRVTITARVFSRRVQ